VLSLEEIRTLLQAIQTGQEKIAADVEAIKMDMAKFRGEVHARFYRLDKDIDTLSHKTYDARFLELKKSGFRCEKENDFAFFFDPCHHQLVEAVQADVFLQ
jgi:hypothetical protein